MATMNRSQPSQEIVTHGVIVTSTPLLPSSTLAAGWQNPEVRPVLAKVFVHFQTGGTGTIDAGLGTGGTGATATQFINGGTMIAGVLTGNIASGSQGSLGGSDWQFIGGNGSATDSIVVTGNEAATGTYAGNMYVTYFVVA